MEQGGPAYKPLVWVVGDSFVHWTSRVAATTGAGLDLNSIATVHWMGKRGLHIADFNDFLHRCWESEQTSPDYIILHVGSNDLGFLPKKAILEAVKSVLTVTRALLPQTIMFWSAILPRVFYPGAFRQNKVERSRRAINRWVSNLMRFASGGLIPHPQIDWDGNCFIHDGVHLTDVGCAVVIRDFFDAVRTAIHLNH